MKQKKYYLCVDLKSFYASVECVERQLDPFTTNLVVADPDRSVSTICLAVTPAMKKLGVKNRCRIHEIPKNIQYTVAMPRMRLYMMYSAWIYSIYLELFAPEDIHVYSVDECFIDITAYLDLYRISPRLLARKVVNRVFEETRITATAGIGTNLYLAKIAMDIIAKHSRENIAMLDELTYRKNLWNHTPLSDFWQIGRRMQSRLEKNGIHTMGDIARDSVISEKWYYKEFGIDAELLIDHAWGYEPCEMRDIKSYRSTEHSMTNGQVLMRNYSKDECAVVVREMAEQLAMRLMKHGFLAKGITLHISYDHKTGVPHTVGSDSFSVPTDSAETIAAAACKIHEALTRDDTGIRRVTIIAKNLTESGAAQLNLFCDTAETRGHDVQSTMLSLKNRFGKNAIFKASNLLACSTMIERNNQIGGHRA